MNLEQCLNEFLADLNVFYRKLQNYHWNVQGRDFFQTHKKLEELYDEVNESIDEIAEHILILGGQPLGTLKDYLAVSTIQEGENKKLKSDEIYNNLITDYEKLLKKSTEIKEEADKQNDYATSALATLVANTRQSADTIGNSLKTIFSRLQGLKMGDTLEDGLDLNKYSKALKAIGVDVLDVNGNMMEMDDVLDTTAEKWETMTQAQKMA